jgi:hypothetical protein
MGCSLIFDVTLMQSDMQGDFSRFGMDLTLLFKECRRSALGAFKAFFGYP